MGAARRAHLSRYHTLMEVRLFPNSRRPGVGLKPKRESQRPLLPQHAQHCPVLGAGSALGFFVYPPLEPHESYHLEFEGDGRYQFTYFLTGSRGRWEGLFRMIVVLPVGGLGIIKHEIEMLKRDSPISREEAERVARTFIVPEDLGTPPGALALRGATNFQTPQGWDTVYTPVFNMIERPVAPMLVVRVETDWYVHETEFRYVFQPGEGVSASYSMPIGQVFFVPREEVTLRDCTAEEIQALDRAAEEFQRQKAAVKATTPYGVPFSPHYQRESKSRKDG